MTSITRKLHFNLIRKKLGIWIVSDLLLFLAVSAAFLFGIEYSRFSTIPALTQNHRSFLLSKEHLQLWYRMTDQNGEVIFQKDITRFLIALTVVFGCLLFLQLLSLLLSYYGENKQIRKILSPINEVALRADELSRLSFSEDKYQVLEDAIEHIRPGESQTLSFQDSDLVGVEAAINNLLVRMRDTYRQQSRFVNDASHELRTPIAVIQGYANMLDRWGKEDEKILDESITAIRNEADHMNHLVEQLLFLARGDSGRTSVTLEDVDLSSMMQEVYEESFMIDETHPYRYRPKEAVLTVRADPALLKQAVRILIDNAAKYTKQGDEILLSCGIVDDAGSADVVIPPDSGGRTASGNAAKAAGRTDSGSAAKAGRTASGSAEKPAAEKAAGRTDSGSAAKAGSAYIQVQDTGIGMEEADVQQMFERFYRSNEVRSYQGTGLGLSIAKWIIDKHGGHFEVLSRTGLGTRIRILLPAADSPRIG